ncbi:MAG: alpha/beta hydrolase, partial [Actinomycetota bacterium]|nr:alpha/beta hydrolase [Actinomycetota bacterium]
PRQVAWMPRQRQDLRQAVRFAAGLEGVDPDRIVLWGWSWGASHAIYTAAAEPALAAAAIVVGPDPDGLATVRHLLSQAGVRGLARLSGPVLRDLAALVRGRPPELIPLVGPPGTVAALTTEESEPSYAALAGPSWRNEVAARVAFAEASNRATAQAEELRCPILIQSGARDSVSPPQSARRLAWKAKGFSELREYPCGHYGFLLELRDRVIDDQLHFLRRHLSPACAEAGTSS